MQKKKASTDELITLILHGIEEVKGNNVNILDFREIENTVCSYFIICDGTSNTHINAIVGSVQKIVSKSIQDKPWHLEGSCNSEWVLMDYVDVVVHVFQKHTREFYDIEGLWADAKVSIMESSLNQ